MSGIEAVFFDIGNVLLRFDAGRLLRRIAWEVGLQPLRVARLLWARKLIDGIERGRITDRELFAIFRDELGFKGGPRRFRGLWCGDFRVDRGCVGLLRRVARRAPAYLLSNTNRMHYEHIRARYAFPGLARGAILSYELGLRKPEPAIYRAALRRAGVPARRALLIDDRRQNVEGARRLGMWAVRYTDAKALAVELGKLGLL